MSRFSSFFSRLQLKHWLPFLILVVLLHLILIQWALSSLAPFSFPDSSDPIVNAELKLQPVPELAKPLPANKSAVPKTKPPVVESETPDDEPVPAETAPTKPNAEKIASTPIPDPAGAPTSASNKPQSLGAVTAYSVNPAPSADLSYNAQSQHKGQNIYGSGRIRWQSDGSAYRIKGEFNILFLTLLNFSSEGKIDPKFGVSPTVYSEKRMRKSETNTHFHRERNTISFSSTTLAYERPGGEQDRASIVWQLVGIGRRDGSKFVPGGVLDIAVAGIRNADVWKVRIVGIEEIETGIGKVRAWRLARAARKDSYEQSLDVWLAPQHEWYPVKVRYTNANGDFLDLSLSEINKLPDR